MPNKNKDTLTILKMMNVLKDLIWIGIDSERWENLMMPVKFIINAAIIGGLKDAALRIAANTPGTTQLCAGLHLHWRHEYHEASGSVIVNFVIRGKDDEEVGYESFLKAAKHYFEHLYTTGSRTF